MQRQSSNYPNMIMIIPFAVMAIFITGLVVYAGMLSEKVTKNEDSITILVEVVRLQNERIEELGGEPIIYPPVIVTVIPPVTPNDNNTIPNTSPNTNPNTVPNTESPNTTRFTTTTIPTTSTASTTTTTRPCQIVLPTGQCLVP